MYRWLIGKDPDPGKDRRQKEKRVAEDGWMVGWHHWLNGHVCEHTQRESEGQGSLQCFCPRGQKQSNWTTAEQQQLNNIRVDSLAAQHGSKNLPARLETWVWSLGCEDPLEKGMATHSSNLAWRIPWTEETGGKELDTAERLTLPFSQQQQYRTVSEMRWIPHMNGVYFWMRVFGKIFL